MNSNHTTLFYNLMQFICGAGVRFHDLRVTTTFVWAVFGLIVSKCVRLNLWALFRPGEAKIASRERQFSRWLHNARIQPMQVYRPLMETVLQEWAGETIYLALDTSQLWGRFTVVCLSLVYRGRALPVGWIVCASGSATVALARYQRMLAQVSECISTTSKVILLADRGFMDVQLMRLARQLGWHFRIRIKSSVYVRRSTKGKKKVKALMPAPGGARFFSHVWLTEQQYGPLHLALAYVQTKDSYEKWAIISDEPVGLHTFDEYGLRFDIEEGFLDFKSAGFQLESSQLEDSESLSRLLLVLTTATLYLVSTGTAVVAMGKRRWVDPHWFRGLSYLQIGWRWVERALAWSGKLLSFLWLSPEPDPEPAMASWRKHLEPDLRLSCIEWYDFVKVH
jgi:hypothetical protein